MSTYRTALLRLFYPMSFESMFEHYVAINDLRAIQKVCQRKNPDFDPLPPCHTLPPFALNPLPLVTTKKVTNFELIMSLILMQILDLIFAKMCIKK